MKLVDSCGRKINYLRLSVTDRCNLRCSYCMPAEGVPKLAHEEVLTYEELLTVAEVAVRIGIEKIRVTGGEPLVRKGLMGFLAQLRQLPGLRHLVLTTNGLLLDESAEQLKEAGVERLNISLDSLKPETYSHITRGGDVSRALAGIRAAETAGLPYKINMVVMRGINDEEIADFAELTLQNPCTVRFIEYMPAARTDNVASLLVPGNEVMTMIARKFDIELQEPGDFDGPARGFRIRGARGSLGIITPISCHFCNDCNRIRVTSAGIAKSCLFGKDALNLKPFLRSGDPTAIEGALRGVVSIKGGTHTLDSGISHEPFTMARIGG